MAQLVVIQNLFAKIIILLFGFNVYLSKGPRKTVNIACTNNKECLVTDISNNTIGLLCTNGFCEYLIVKFIMEYLTRIKFNSIKKDAAIINIGLQVLLQINAVKYTYYQDTSHPKLLTNFYFYIFIYQISV
jgi:hypothetical protein